MSLELIDALCIGIATLLTLAILVIALAEIQKGENEP